MSVMDRDGCVKAVVRVVESPTFGNSQAVGFTRPSGCITGVMCPCFSLLDGVLGGVTSCPAPGESAAAAGAGCVGSIPAGGSNGRFPCLIYPGCLGADEWNYPAQIFPENGRFLSTYSGAWQSTANPDRPMAGTAVIDGS